MSDIETGDIQGLAAKTFRKLDQSLKWTPGSARRTYDGGRPEPTEDRVPLQLRTVPIDALLGEIRRRVVSVGGADDSEVWPPAHLRVEDADKVVEGHIARSQRGELPG